MDSIEMAAVIVGSAIMAAMIFLAGRRSWLDRRKTERGFEQRHSSKAMAA